MKDNKKLKEITERKSRYREKVWIERERADTPRKREKEQIQRGRKRMIGW